MKNYLFDLDGTIIDPKVGITSSVQYGLKKMGYEDVPSSDELEWFIGPPLHESFKIHMNSDDEQAFKAVECYRENYRVKGIFECTLYSGIEKLLQELISNNKKIYLATSKPHVYAKQILEHFKIDQYFDGIYGSEFDGTRTNKAELIQYVIEKENLQRSETIMIGDREHDIIGAVKNKITSCGVTYGYGSHEELKKAGADFTINTPAELL